MTRQRGPVRSEVDVAAVEDLLGLMLVFPTAVDEVVAAGLDGYDFGHVGSSYLVAETILGLHRDGETVDAIAVAERSGVDLDRLRSLQNSSTTLAFLAKRIEHVAALGRRDRVTLAVADYHQDGNLDRLTTSLAALSDRNGDRPDGVNPGQSSVLAGVRTGDWLDRQSFPPLRYHVDRVVPEGLTLNVGAPKIGKSWLVLAYSLAIACGGRVLGRVPVAGRPVLYLALEDGDRRLQDRCRKLLDGGPIPAGFEYLTRVEPGKVLATIKAWLARHPGASPFVVLDTLGKVMPPAQIGETTYQRDYRVGGALKDLADDHDGSGLLVNHHDRKAVTDDFVASVSGTNGLAGAADTIVVLSRRRNDANGVLRVTGRDVIEGEYAMRFEAGHRWSLDGRDFEEASDALRQRQVTENLGDRSAAIIGYATNKAQAVTPTEIAERYDIDGDAAGKYLRRLVEQGRLVKHGRGRFAVPGTPSEVSEVSEPDDQSDRPDTSDTAYKGDR